MNGICVILAVTCLFVCLSVCLFVCLFAFSGRSKGKGRAFVSSNFARYNQMQLDAFAPQPFTGKVDSNSSHLTLRWEDACPSVRVLRVNINGA
jgi:hypothetical protein